MQSTNLKNVLAQFVKPNRFVVMAKKLYKRFADDAGSLSKDENLRWIQSNCLSFEAFARELDADLWEETQRVSSSIAKHAQEILRTIEFDLGGGGIYPFLYFITRYTQPNCIVETGVAAGFSSSAFLSAIKANGKGRLYSSDFPYFRLSNPEQYIGVIVKASLQDNWTLYIDGDETNLPRILGEIDKIDIFHYDSDKSYSGRRTALSIISTAMRTDWIILMDDIQDNTHFIDHIRTTGVPEWAIFEFEGKYAGMIGKLKKSGA